MNHEPQSLTASISQAWGAPQADDWAAAWDTTEAAAHFAPLPSGKYVALAKSGALGQSKNGIPRYRLDFEILEGEHAGRRLTHDFYLSAAALSHSKRDLATLGITHPDQLKAPLRPVRVCICVALRQDDSGTAFNRVREIETMPHTAPAAAVVSSKAAVPSLPAASPSSAPPALFDTAFGLDAGGAPHA